MRKVNFKNSRCLNLVGVLESRNKKTFPIVIISHGSASNKDRPRLVRLSESIYNAGFSTLRFDYGGSGESDDSVITVSNYVDDLKSVIRFVRKRDITRLDC